jgi:hypothetical protein
MLYSLENSCDATRVWRTVKRQVSFYVRTKNGHFRLPQWAVYTFHHVLLFQAVSLGFYIAVTRLQCQTSQTCGSQHKVVPGCIFLEYFGIFLLIIILSLSSLSVFTVILTCCLLYPQHRDSVFTPISQMSSFEYLRASSCNVWMHNCSLKCQGTGWYV